MLEKLNLLAFKLDADELELVLDMANACAEYVSAVTRMELVRQQGNKMMDGAEYRAEVERLDTNRSRIHNTLIGQIDAVNRLCERKGVEPLYQGGKERREYGDFAIALVDAVFGERL